MEERKVLERTECLGMERILKALRSLNPTGTFEISGWNTISSTGICPSEIKCPEGYYFDEDVITNKQKGVKIYERFQII